MAATAHSTQHTAHSTQHTAHSTQHTAHSTQNKIIEFVRAATLSTGTALLTLALAACGGGGGGGGPAPTPTIPTTHTVTASSGSGGSISPATATVNQGETATFSIVPDDGYGIESVTGCDGVLSGTAYTTGAISTNCAVAASFRLPLVSIANSEAEEGHVGTSLITFTVNLSEQANGNVTVDYSTSNDTATGGASCDAGVDYITPSGTLTIPAGTTGTTLDIQICGDTNLEPSESFTITLSNISANAIFGMATATGTISNDDAAGINDTGITLCGDYANPGANPGSLFQNDHDCAAVGATATTNGTDTSSDLVPGGQDAHYGRDANSLTNSDADGRAGFSFTKLNSSGNPLPDQSANYATSPWDCVQDNVTGLIWEVKTNDGGLHHKAWVYTWYNSDASTNGGNSGATVGGTCFGGSSNCDTEKFVAAVNAAGWCGHNDWRLPTASELLSIVDNSVPYPGPTIDTNWFPNFPTSVSFVFCSSSPYATDPAYVWGIPLYRGNLGIYFKFLAHYVRLVRVG